jgi:diketogulonate reductase-like aldo/keto reductase
MTTLKEIPKLGLGTYKLKTQSDIANSMHYAIASGYRMFDTAALYRNEHLISHFIENNLSEYKLTRNDIWITTKVAYFTMLYGEISIRKSIEHSLECFSGYIDLLLIHASNANDILTWEIIREYQRAGKVLNVGISNYNVDRLIKFCNMIGPDESKYIYTNQLEFNPYLNRTDLIDECKQRGIRIIAYGSLYKSTEPITKIANHYSVSEACILLKWSSQLDCIVIPMSKDEKEINENYYAIYKFEELTANEIDAINSLDEGYTKYRKHL